MSNTRKIRGLIQDLSKSKLLEKIINTYLFIIFAVISVSGLGYMLFREVQYIAASAPCPDPLKSPITGIVELNADDYVADNVIDCSAVDIQIQNGGILRILPHITDNGDDSDDFGLVIQANNFTIDEGGLLDLEGQGYGAGAQAAHVGSGKSSVTTCSGGLCGGSGGGHGGAGGRGDPDGSNEAGEAGQVYGSKASPITLGSGGGESATSAVGGVGGGAIKLEVSGTLTVNGEINANGTAAAAVGGSGAGGGAGGSIWVEADGFAGTGNIFANGGNGGSSTKMGGGGGGGRIAMRCTSSNTFSGSALALEGTGGIQDGQIGTQIGPSCYPLAPTNLRQLEITNTTIENYLETEIVDNERTKKVNMAFRFDVADIENPSDIFPQIELREVGQPFTGTPTHTGDIVSYAGTPVEGVVKAYGLIKTKEYKWQARALDEHGIPGPWVEFETDAVEEIDFIALGDPSVLVQVSGDGQTGTVGQPLASPFVVELRDSVGHTIPNESISWEVKYGEGSLSEYLSTTDTNGQVQTTLTLGTAAGTSNNKVNAIKNGVSGSPLAFYASANPGALHHYFIQSPGLALISTNFSPDVRIEARDEFENKITTNNDTVNLSAVLVEDNCPDTCNPGTGTLTPSQATLASGEVFLSNVQYDTAEAIRIKAENASITGYSNSVNVVTAYGSCFGVANIVANSPLIINEDKNVTASPAEGGVINCSNIDVTVETGYTVELRSLEVENGNYTDEITTTLIAKSLTVQSGAEINADGWGYEGGNGPNHPGNGGGTHGGYGGDSNADPYGNVFEPTSLGSGSSHYSSWAGRDGGGQVGDGISPGAGGGAIKFVITNTLTVDGLISSNGIDGYEAFDDASMGAGGSVWIDTDILTGSGEIRADGGDTRDGSNYDAGGGGGRIAIEYNTETFGTGIHNEADGGNIHAFGGNGDGGTKNGGPGTIYIEQKGVDPDEGGYLYVDNNGDLTNPAGIVEDSYQFTQIQLTRYGDLVVLGNGSVLNVPSGSTLKGDSTISELDIQGTFNYTGGDRFLLDDIHVIISGDVTGVTDFTVANLTPAHLTLKAHTWARSGTYTFNDVDINADGIVILAGYDNQDVDWTNDYGVHFNVTNLDVKTSGILSADGQGYYYRNGPGYPGVEAGAGYGGYGGSSSINGGGIPYGNVYEPTDLGSGGHFDSWGAGLGRGGGAMKLTNTFLNIDGHITADGIEGRTNFDNTSQGSGGSIWIQATNISGSGSIGADGGSTSHAANGDQSGGGGRIAIEYTNDTFGTGLKNEAGGANLHAFGGVGDGGTRDGGAGTIYIEQSGVDVDEGAFLYADNNGKNTNMAGLPEDDYEFTQIKLTRYGHLQLMGVGSNVFVSDPLGLQGDNTSTFEIIGTIHLPDTVEINNMTVSILGDIASLVDGIDTSNMNVTVGSVGKLRLYAEAWGSPGGIYEFDTLDIDPNAILYLNGYDTPDTIWTNDYGITIDANDVTVDANGLITAEGLGYGGGRGTGRGTSHQSPAHGGVGDNNTTGVPYGDVYEPVDLGSGGTHSGGGAIKILTNNLTVNGEINADGATASGNNTTGGAGGSIWLDVNDTFTGSGIIQANGGDYVSAYSERGSGGRIAIYYDNDTSTIINTLGTGTPRVTTYGGTGTSNAAGAGTIYLEHIGVDPQKGANLYVDNMNNDVHYAALPEDTYEFNLVKLTREGHLSVLGQNSILTVTGSDSIRGDTSAPELTVEGTFNAPQVFNINEYTLDIQGEIQLGPDTSQAIVTLGDTAPGALRLRANTWAHNDTVPYAFSDVTIASQGTLFLHSHEELDDDWTNDYGIEVTTDNLIVESGGLITAEGLGYRARKGPGQGDSHKSALHGGTGVNPVDGSEPYGDVYEPHDLGSGGTWTGGGAIKLNTTNLSLDGEINADGSTASGNNNTGGAGGSIWLDISGTLSGGGSIQANGGDYTGAYSQRGSGGRIAIYYINDTSTILSTLGTDTPKVTATGGTGTGDRVAGPGTIYVEQSGVEPYQGANLYVDNRNIGQYTAVLPEADYTFENIALTRTGNATVSGNNSTLTVTSSTTVNGDVTAPDLTVEGTFIGPQIYAINGYTLEIKGEITLGTDTALSDLTVGDTDSGGLKLHANTWAHDDQSQYQLADLTIGANGLVTLHSYQNGDNFYDNDYGLELTTTNLNIATGGEITTTGTGYPSYKGPGYAGNERTGSSHGGYGGIGDSQVPAAPTYGDLYQPTDLGSGTQSEGGGAIKLMTTDLVLNGTISANGNDASSRASGSGGSVWIDTTTITGTGTITANAGRGDRYSGGGGGGRVAVYYETDNGFTFDSTHLQATGHQGSYRDGGPGTVYIEHVGTHEAGYGNLFIDNATYDPDSYGMDFYPRTYTFNDVSIGGNSKLRMIGDQYELLEGVTKPDPHETGVEAGMVGVWRFNETVDNSCAGGEDACDSSGNNYHGTDVNGSIISSGKYGNARSFDGGNDYIDVGNLGITGNAPRSIELWFKSGVSETVQKDEAGLFNLGRSDGDNLRAFVITATDDSCGGAISLYFDSAQTCTNLKISDLGINTWHHAAVTHSGTEQKVYINGVLAGSSTRSDLNTENGNSYIGLKQHNSREFLGSVDEVIVYDHVITEEEIVAHFYGLTVAEFQALPQIPDRLAGKGVTFDLTGNFSLSTGAILDGSGFGFFEIDGPQPGGIGPGENGGGGGGHGGAGGLGQNDTVNSDTPGGDPDDNDSSTEPRHLGSGGGTSGTGANGGRGGSALLIKSTGTSGTITIDGTIDMSGSDGTVSGNGGGGGGAGGSIHLEACDIYINAAGVLDATGGDAGTSTYTGGGGGGGIIALANRCSDTIVIDGGSTINVDEGTGYQPGGIGIFGQHSTPQVSLQDQYTIDDIQINVGGEIEQRAVKFRITASDPDIGTDLRPEVEVQYAGDGTGFDGTNIIQASSATTYNGTPIEVDITVQNTNGGSGLVIESNGNVLGIAEADLDYGEEYKWRARVYDVSEGVYSDWVEFGSNNDGTDFQIAPAPTCGNNTTEFGEECDGTDLSGEDCSSRGYLGGTLSCSGSCTFDESGCYNQFCGDGLIHGTEECDGSNLNGETCQTRGYDAGTLSCNACSFDESGCYDYVCGNDTTEPGEVCDGSDLTGLDCTDFDDFDSGTLSCNGTCSGFETSACVKDPTCGNSVIESGEQCDDGNTIDNDGCDSSCNLEVTGSCGDGVIQEVEGETCDDGNQISGDGCSNVCTVESGTGYCGDGSLDAGEACDDGNQISGDGCSNICTVEVAGGYCGDGALQGTEECDDGNQLSGDGCSNICALEQGDCGNGVLEYGEQCDATDLGTASCESLGFDRGTLTCSAECTWVTNACDSDPECGNGVIEPGEVCDGNNFINSCDDFFGYDGGELICTNQCQFDFSSCNVSSGESGTGLFGLPLTGGLLPITGGVFTSVGVFLAIISLLLGFPSLLKKREKNPWGIIYNEKNRKPIAFAVVRLFQSGKLIAEKVTDLQGRYGFAVSVGSYDIEVKHAKYESVKKSVKTKDETEGTVNRDIALTPREKEQSIGPGIVNFFRTKLSDAREAIPRISLYLYIGGFIFTIFATIISPVVYNFLVIAFYIALGIFHIIRRSKRGWGRVYNAKSKSGVGYTFVRIFDSIENKMLDTQLTEKGGEYLFLIKPGTYHLFASKDGYTFPAKSEKKKKVKVYLGEVVEIVHKEKNKAVGVDLAMEKKTTSTQKQKEDVILSHGNQNSSFGKKFGN